MSHSRASLESDSTESGYQHQIISRRVFLKASAACLTGLVAAPSCSMGVRSKAGRGIARFGIVTDTHYADTDTVGTRFYRDSLDKLTECVELMNARNVDFLIEIGDFKDQDYPAVEKRTIYYLQAIEKIFQQFNGPTYHVLGNHDEDSISKTQFLTHVKNTGIGPDRSYYSFDFNGLHFVVLDANYRGDGVEYDRGNFDWTDTNIPPAELDWLKQDLNGANSPAIVFVHQLLDGRGPVYVNNAEAVRQVLEESDNVLCVFQGHHHAGSYNYIREIHYYTLKAMVEGPGPDNNSYAIVDFRGDRSITITGYRRAISRRLSAVSAPVAS